MMILKTDSELSSCLCKPVICLVVQHLANSLLEMEEEKAIWSSKEKALTEAIEEKIRLYNIQNESLSKEISEVCSKRGTSFSEIKNRTFLATSWSSNHFGCHPLELSTLGIAYPICLDLEW